MPARATLPIWTLAYDGDLEADVIRWRDHDGISVELIAEMLRSRGVDISTRTLYRWLSSGFAAS